MSNLKEKQITLISLNFYPEDTAIGLYSTQLAEYLAAQGAQVTVITAFPYYPQWEIWKAYRDKQSFVEEYKGSIRVLRYKQYVPKQPTFLKRVLHIIDFTLGTMKNLKRVKECDIVISVIPFTSSAWLGNTLSRKRKAKHWIHIQDFEFDAAFQSGLASEGQAKGFVYNQLMSLERRILNKADRVSTISHSMLKKLNSKTKTRTYFLPNWVDPTTSDPSEVSHHPYINKEKFTILYSGNVGDKQDWVLFEEVVRLLDFSIFEVIIVGAGAKVEALKGTLKDLPIQWYNPVPFSDLASLLTSTDVHILFQKIAINDTVMPSKILGMMASARPSIITGNPEGEPAKIFAACQGGYYESAPDAMLIVQYLRQLQVNSEIARDMGAAARTYIIQQFAKDSILKDFTEELSTL